MDRVDEDHRIDTFEWPGLPRLQIRGHRIGDPGDQTTRDLGVVDLGQMIGDVAGGHALRVQADHRLIEPRQAPLAFSHDRRLE